MWVMTTHWQGTAKVKVYVIVFKIPIKMVAT